MSTSLSKNYPWIQTPLVVNGPMAGTAGARLAVAVTLAGGIGFIGAGVDMKKGGLALAEARNLLAPAMNLDKNAPVPVGFGILCFGASLDEAVETITEHKPAIVWLFATNDDRNDYRIWTKRIRESSASPPQIWIQTSSVESILHLAEHVKPDVLVVQGSDAGGHGASPGASLISVLPEAADALAANGYGDIPLIAAGGIADARGAAAALALGAQGICMGTRFIASVEAEPTYAIYKDIVIETKDAGYTTVRSQVFDEMNARGNIWPKGYDGRALRNAITKDQEDGVALEELRSRYAESTATPDGGFQTDITTLRASIWAGTGAGLVTKVMTAGDIVRSVKDGAREILNRVSKEW